MTERHSFDAIALFLKRGMPVSELQQAFGRPDRSFRERPGENWDTVWEYFGDDAGTRYIYVQIDAGVVVGWSLYDRK